MENNISHTERASERKQRYKMLMDNLQKHYNIENNFSIEQLLQLQANIASTDEIHQKTSDNMNELLNNTTELLMDAQVLKSLHEIISKVFSANTDFNETKYSTALKSLIYQNGDCRWENITKIAVGIAKTTLTNCSLLGALNLEYKEPTIKERRKRSSKLTVEENQPEIINQLKRKDRGAEIVNFTLKQINTIFKANDYRPVPYYQMIIDPNNFMNTVENALQIAFLVKDGNIAIERGPDGHPQVCYLERSKVQDEEVANAQAVCSLDVKKCQEFIKIYQIKQAMLKVAEENTSEANG